MSDINILTENMKKINSLKIEKNKMLAPYTSFKVGGPADLFVEAETVKSLQKALPLIVKSGLPYFVLGKGSNLITSDKGYRGIIIYTGSLRNYTVEDNTVKAESGLLLSELADICCKASLSGLEFASGIPGSLGGAVYMNAGAYGREMKDVIKKAELLQQNGEIIELSRQELQLDYRSSILQSKNYIITSATLELESGDKEKIQKQIDKLHAKRWSKQPMEQPSAGSIFKRPPGHYTGPLIEKAGMKGYQIGGAQVSTKHAGFIVNKGNATSDDIINLIEKVKEEVYKISGVRLEVEPRLLGKF
ncbi:MULTISPECIES: UDP-N-acetylmuramate dehydrogenase [unclassified Halanaerobium]|uniref:UDP-N-acetylmuramate dehydrogenase n=1 Tax=unclassified Halanaerobium TaxID=2641197 RepID=UPI000DF2E679|nr:MULTISPECIES: UDP-N-acetylmuramate dehydrogenase [unclassified Halanaerobium]RCW49937.1 UDP-N-acetylmuramate dehydrogenase [Halanaerobium sp. MA284_MarDTE_T2]RCW81078.1 UDP-N-acetylmuramate dehydrogenase [Halanaerobium sp. DL-01]